MANVGSVADEDEEFARPRTAAGVLYLDEAGRVMLVKPTYKPGWEIPGGYVKPGESPAAAALREVVEEVGTALPVGALLVVDWAPVASEGDKLLFVFDGGVLSTRQADAIRVDGTEISEFAFHARHDLDGLLIPRLARRVHAAIGARAAGQGVYLEHGSARSAGG
jgi:8-oxo-dGTP pyrophosphatase MutT (NUDIX family)